MKKYRASYEYRYKFKIDGMKAVKSWGIRLNQAFKQTASVLKGLGYVEAGVYKIAHGRHIIKLVKKHKHGKKILVVFATRLSQWRKMEHIVDRPSRLNRLNP